jgi:hypothetical protein
MIRRQQRWRDLQAPGLGGLDVDDEFELGRLLDGEISGFGALQDPDGVIRERISS